MRKFVLATAAILGIGLVFLLASPGTTLSLAKGLERRRAGLSEHTASVGDFEIVYTDGGAGEVLLMVHGFNADKDNWTRMAAALTDDYRVVALDLPGFGQSSRIDGLSYDAGTQADRLKAFHDAVGLAAVHLVGNSMGGEIVAVYATRYPEDVATLTLVDAAGVASPQPSEYSRLLAEGKNPLIAGDVDEYDALMDFVFVEKPWVPRPILAHFAQVAIDNRPFTEKIWQDFRGIPSGLEERLSTIAAPTLVIWGDTDRVLDVSMAAVFDDKIPDSRVSILTGVGHLPMLERPDETAALLRDFLSDQRISR